MPNRTRVPVVVLAGALLLAACGGGPAKGTALSDATGPTSTVAGSTPSTSLVTTAVTTPTTTAPTTTTVRAATPTTTVTTTKKAGPSAAEVADLERQLDDIDKALADIQAEVDAN